MQLLEAPAQTVPGPIPLLPLALEVLAQVLVLQEKRRRGGPVVCSWVALLQRHRSLGMRLLVLVLLVADSHREQRQAQQASMGMALHPLEGLHKGLHA